MSSPGDVTKEDRMQGWDLLDGDMAHALAVTSLDLHTTGANSGASWSDGGFRPSSAASVAQAPPPVMQQDSGPRSGPSNGGGGGGGGRDEAHDSGHDTGSLRQPPPLPAVSAFGAAAGDGTTSSTPKTAASGKAEVLLMGGHPCPSGPHSSTAV